jgi:hypothetical protein
MTTFSCATPIQIEITAITLNNELIRNVSAGETRSLGGA